jgi:hypothetical protein
MMSSRRDLNPGDWLEINQTGVQAAANPFLIRQWKNAGQAPFF